MSEQYNFTEQILDDVNNHDVQDCIAILRLENHLGDLLQEFPIFDGEVAEIGRDPDRHSGGQDEIRRRYITLPDDLLYPVVSKNHFRIYSVIFDKKAHDLQPLIYCEDLESTNGTYVNDTCIGMIGRERIAHLLSHGDVITVRPDWRFRLYQPQLTALKGLSGKSEDLEMQYSVSKRILGSGQYGSVFLANEVATSKQVACKIVDFEKAIEHRGDPSSSPFFVIGGLQASSGKDAIMREVKILAALSHPHIVNLRKVFYSQNTLYTFTDLAPGGDLFSYIEKCRDSITDCEGRIIARQIVMALEFMHSNGVAHRDIKPENVLIMQTDFGGRVVLTDFGFATYTRERAGRMLSKVGTDGYLAPEVDRVERTNQSYTTAADMWSLGVLTAHLLTAQSILTQEEVPRLSQIQIAERFLAVESRNQLKPRAVRFLQRLFVLNPSDRMTAVQALNHSWFKKPDSEAAAIEDVCRKMTRFWKKRDDQPDTMIEALPGVRRDDRVDDESSRQYKSRRKIPDASSYQYFGLERHLQQRPSSQRRTLLEDLNKSGSQFIATKESSVSRLRDAFTHGSDIFGKSHGFETQYTNSPEDDEGMSVIPTTTFPIEKTYGFTLNAATSPSNPQDYFAATDLGNSQQGSNLKRVRFESEDPEERALRDAVAKAGPRWQTAKDFGDALKKRKMELVARSGNTQRQPLGTLPIRTSSKSAS
ncbi:serine/threonine protein kinase [Drepanopeziza brunnea f. sp. 'multigermtubi' MB_m1]|uniref:Serine/threonine protein kinase n=1 Tax=Marssonina brunnea f. sp. multigermtubi (strain MB_m1) TaxID=1072389 RepID=K1X265_MARBU|nr:serine/threonine protein kinase [Drepanopeziza brunnea f. sp. 'multigermtubi' MB_m1]EKD14883.1 serine/threonine protein kinase [Drepanopeziza brunnea f. sp. 'multigermtubi' MB_m1]